MTVVYARLRFSVRARRTSLTFPSPSFQSTLRHSSSSGGGMSRAPFVAISVVLAPGLPQFLGEKRSCLGKTRSGSGGRGRRRWNGFDVLGYICHRFVEILGFLQHRPFQRHVVAGPASVHVPVLCNQV